MHGTVMIPPFMWAVRPCRARPRGPSPGARRLGISSPAGRHRRREDEWHTLRPDRTNHPMRGGVHRHILDRTNRPIPQRSDAMSLSLRAVDLERFDRTLTTILSPLAHARCDDWRAAVESSVAELLDGDHVVFGLPRLGMPMHVHSMNIPAQPQRAIQTLFGRLPDLPPDPWLQDAERERLQSSAEVWSRLRAFWRAAAGQPAALRRSALIGEVLTPG